MEPAAAVDNGMADKETMNHSESSEYKSRSGDNGSENGEKSGGVSKEEEDAEESQEDRIEWLRQRGVLIDIPNEKKTKKHSSSAAPQIVDVTVVKIPFNELLPYEEVTVSVDLSLPGDQLITALAHYFSSAGSEIDKALLKETAQKQFGTADIAISEKTIESLASKGSVEVFHLAQACEANKFTAISFYLDEAGALKCLPFNSRASSIASQCGFKGVNLCGDMFIGRTRLSPSGGVKNESIFANEIESSADWMRNAERNNYQVGVANNRVVMENQTAAAALEEAGMNAANIRSVDSLTICGSAAGIEKEGKGFKWSQTDSTVDVSVTLPQGQGPKTIAVKFSKTSVTVTNKAAPSTVYLSLNLTNNISSSESTWACSSKDGNYILDITMEKSVEGFWQALEK
jgi:hypothetical protein